MESALASQLPATARPGQTGSRDPDPGEPRAKRHKGAGKEHKRKQPEHPAIESGRGRGSPSVTAQPPLRSRQAPVAGETADANEWQQVSRRETEPFELRAQDWDAPIVPHTGVGKTTRIPGRVGNMLRFRQAKTVQIQSAGKAAAGYAGHKADAVKVAPVETCVISIRIPEAYLSAERWKGFRTNPTRAIVK